MQELADFIVEAKRRTYAGLDDRASVPDPLLGGSKQLEFRSGRHSYRDIYFGMAFFVGQETVSENGKVIWSMSYSGGVRPEITERAKLQSIYKFLRQALSATTLDRPFRGPESFRAGDMAYVNRVEGSLERFHGEEQVSENGLTLFDLRYGGGLVR